MAAYLFIFSHSMLYQITLYSENTFLFLTLLGLLFLYSEDRSKQSFKNRPYTLPRSSNVLLACFFFGLATMSRSTGLLLSVYIAYYMGNKILIELGKCRIMAAFKYILVSLLCIVVMFTPVILISYYIPYKLYCLNQSNSAPQPIWCDQPIPNLYGFIQFVYWDNRFLGFFYRPLDNFLTSLPMTLLFYALIYTSVKT